MARLGLAKRLHLGDLLEDYYYYSPLCGYTRHGLEVFIRLTIDNLGGMAGVW